MPDRLPEATLGQAGDTFGSMDHTLDHVQVAAPPGCEPAAREFYGGLLGLNEVAKPNALAARGGVWFQLGEQQLHIGVEAAFVPATKAHPAIRTADSKQLAAIASRLERAGCPVSWDDGMLGLKRFYATDPWGNRLELMAPVTAAPRAKYARPEFERRWRVTEVPDPSAAQSTVRIEDRYIEGTGLRIRRVEDAVSSEVAFKLGQKLRPDPSDPRLVMHTTTYLSVGEYEALRALGGAVLRKSRSKLLVEGIGYGVDIFEGRHRGLILVEGEARSAGEAAALTAPPFAIDEVTLDERFTGGGLAFMDDAELAGLLNIRR